MWGLPVTLLFLAVATACAPPAPDTVLLNGRVFTANPAQPWAEAVAIRGDRVVAVGTTAEVSALASRETSTRDLAGRVVVPGFNDAHVTDPGGERAALVAFARAAVAAGVTSMHWFVGARTVKEAAAAVLGADLPIRIRMLRMPRPGPDGTTIDSRPHLPPQPGFRLDIRGMGFLLGAADEARIRQVVGWAYGTEDLLAIEPADVQALPIYVEAIEQEGLPEVWARKRPRVEQAGMGAVVLAPRLAGSGMVVVQRPGGTVPLASLVKGGVSLALGSGLGTRPFDVLAWATSPEHGAEALTMEQAVAAFTRGSAYAEFTDREKGHLTVGALADLAVLSLDPFTAAREELGGMHSVLTVIGGRVVHDVR
ncbi:MAG: amidohydrolase family protein [Acidobacteria bacterium]|nr:amidohydrolase family protein [Acidobacteriota bacterium]